MDNSAELFSVINAAGEYQFVGGSVKNLLGYSPTDMVGRSAFEYIHPDDQDIVGASMGSALFNRTTDLPNFRFLHRNGSWRWIQCRITNLSDNPEVMGYITNSIDITEKVEGERDQIRTQAHYESLFFQHPDAVFELDRGGYFTLVNKNFQAMTGYSPTQIQGMHFRDLVLPKDLPIAMGAFLSALEGKAQQIELDIVQLEGKEVSLSIAIVPVLIDGGIVKIQGIARDITLQKKYATYVKAQAEQLYAIMERVPESFFSLDRSWRYTYVNRFYCNYIGRGREELMGKNIWEVFPSARYSTFYATCLEVAKTSLPRYTEEVSPYNADTVINLQVYPTGEDISVHFVDITERKREQDRLEKLSLVASKTNTCIIILNKHGQIEWTNEAFEKVTGYTLQESLQKAPVALLSGPETSPKTNARLLKRIKKGKPFSGELLNYTKQGTTIWFNLELTPVYDAQGELTKFISIRTDITQRKQKELELLEVTRDLFQQNHDLQHFSYMVSHNLRAPAANIMGLSHLLTRLDKNSATYEKTIRNIQKSADVLDTVIKDMNHALSIRDNEFEVPMGEVNLAEVVQEALYTFDYKLKQAQCLPQLDVAEDLAVCSNKPYLLEVLKHLLSNAIKFRSQNRPLQIALKAKQVNGAVSLSLSDNGIGINLDIVKDDLFKIYKKFHVGYQGRGIGFFLVKTYLEKLKGDIKVNSEVNKGTTVKIKLRRHACI